MAIIDINDEVLTNERAEYGKQIVVTVAQQLENLYSKNFTEKNVRRMMQFSVEFSDYVIVVPLARQLSWSHFLALIPLKSIEAKLHQLLIEAKERIERNRMDNLLLCIFVLRDYRDISGRGITYF